ncbi:MAG: exosortase/archaeosortase family protein [Sedimentisphaerales bacterium]|nr:exosortase/archaeosortase family protein [Sedimentisphaerales bacterium]
MKETIELIGGQGRLPRQHVTQWVQVPVHTWVKVGILTILFLYLFRYQIGPVVTLWFNDASWSHGLLIPLFSLYFLNQRKLQILQTESKPNWLGMVFILLSLMVLLLMIVQFRMTYLEQLTVVAALGAVVLFLGGWPILRYTWLPILYLIFAIPLPQRILRALTIPMRTWAADIAAWFLNLVPNLQATNTGVVIDVVYKGTLIEPALDVAEACSGMRLLTAFLALGVAMAYLHERPILHRIVLLISTVPIAIFCNIIRVTITGLIYVLWDPKYAQGIYHDMLGLLMLPLAFGLYGLLAWFMGNLLVEETAASADVVIRKRGDGGQS